ncbi:IclR family transcriptional regulator [Mycolicibacterium litorale]|uniref:IclR family transcriptional regulator n=1 Tax=Mycolicibacterium litorale TaxID=758802 RepID=UPI003CEC9F31
MNEAPRAPAVVKAVAVLRRLAEAPPAGPVRLATLAQDVGTAKSSLLTVLNALLDGGLIQRSEAGYSLGPSLVGLSSAYLAGVNEIEAFYSACRRSAQHLADTIHLATFSADVEISYLARIDGLTTPLVSPIGRSLPATCSATGKALLSKLDEEEVSRRFDGVDAFPQLTSHSVANLEELLQELKVTRERGFGMDDEETTPGLLCVGMVVPTGFQPRWAVGITMVKPADPEPRIREAVEVLRSVTRDIAHHLGH